MCISRSRADVPAGFCLCAFQVPFEEHTTDKYALLANERLKAEGWDIEGAYFNQEAFQVSPVHAQHKS